MDLKRFIQRQRLVLAAVFGILNRDQTKHVEKISKLVLRTSSEEDGQVDDSSDDAKPSQLPHPRIDLK